jgi:hypothetical protein
MNTDAKHRVIGIRHTLKEFKNRGMIDEDVMYAKDAAEKTQELILEKSVRWHKIGFKRGAIEALNAILDGDLYVERNIDGEIEIYAKKSFKALTWNGNLIVRLGEKHKVSTELAIKIKNLEFD